MPDDLYTEFENRIRRMSNISNAAGIVRWDQEVMMPEGGTPARSQQLSALSAVQHELLTEDPMDEWLDKLDDASLPDDRQAVVREVRREYERANRVPTNLVEKISEVTSEAHPAWKKAKETDSFDEFAPVLEQLVELKREYAEHIDPNRDPYAVLFEEYEPYLDLKTADTILTELRDQLVPLIDDIADADTKIADPFTGSYDSDIQHSVAEDVLDLLGYDWTRGRLDTAPHPFSSGTQFDARITTRFNEEDPLDSLTSTIHEFGHARYTQGLPQDKYGTPLGESRDLSVHESQSRFWENHIGRSKPFWEQLLPILSEHFPQLAEVPLQEAYEAANKVDPDNLIRVEADELTYHLHIIIRYEIERDLISGDLSVEDVPAVWNEKYEQYLGVRPESDAEGCLQDIHWSHGSFGYFPTYSLGSVLAAQINHAIRSELDVSSLVRAQSFDQITDWLQETIHQHGCRYRTDELIEHATGEPLTAEYFCTYAEDKYSQIYNI